nr:hypothetical protein [Tanacetum cinerariifolium]
SKPEDETVPTGRYTLQLLPPVHRFSGNFYVGEGSSIASLRKVFRPGPLGKDVNALHYKVKSLAQQINIRAETEFSNLKRLSDVEWHWSVEVREHLPRHKHYRERPGGDTTILVAHLDPDDPYMSAATDVLIVHEENLSPEL